MNATESTNVESSRNTKVIFDNVIKLLSIFPLFLFIGILYQFSRLVSINKLTFFSWSQVINDTVALFFPILFGIGGYIIANFLDPHVQNHKKFFGNLFLYGIVFFTVYIGLKGFGLPYILYQSYIIGVFASIIPTIFTYTRIHTGSEKLKNKDNLLISRIITGIALFFAILAFIKDTEYKDLRLTINGTDKEIIYMNDTYVFTKDSIYHNSESLYFTYSGVTQ